MRPGPTTASASCKSSTSKLLTAQLALLLQALERGKGFRQWVRTAPVQQVAVELAGAQGLQRALKGGDGTRARGVGEQQLGDQEHLAAPYISAVSMCVRPRSSPRRSAAKAYWRSLDSIGQVPWPITGTHRPVGPKSCYRIMVACP